MKQPSTSSKINADDYTTFEQQVLTRLELIIARLDVIDERLEAVEVRLSDIDLDTGSGFSIED